MSLSNLSESNESASELAGLRVVTQDFFNAEGEVVMRECLSRVPGKAIWELVEDAALAPMITDNVVSGVSRKLEADKESLNFTVNLMPSELTSPADFISTLRSCPNMQQVLEKVGFEIHESIFESEDWAEVVESFIEFVHQETGSPIDLMLDDLPLEQVHKLSQLDKNSLLAKHLHGIKFIQQLEKYNDNEELQALCEFCSKANKFLVLEQGVNAQTLQTVKKNYPNLSVYGQSFELSNVASSDDFAAL